MNQRSERTWFFGHIAGRKQDEHARSQIKAEYLPTCVGNIRMEITKVWCYDLLGFIALPLPSKYWKALKAESLLILPKLCEMPVMVSRQSRDFAGESEEYSREKGGDDPSEIFRIRDYQPGDKIRSIHWKLSAKTDGLIVQERSLPLGCPVDLYLNLYQPVMRRNQESINRDSYLLIAASVSHSIVQEGCRHHVIWFDHERGDIRRYRIETEEDVYEMLLRLGRLLTYPQQKDLQDLYLQKYHETPGITCLELHINLSLEKNGVCVQKFHGSLEEIEQQITAKELIV